MAKGAKLDDSIGKYPGLDLFQIFQNLILIFSQILIEMILTTRLWTPERTLSEFHKNSRDNLSSSNSKKKKASTLSI